MKSNITPKLSNSVISRFKETAAQVAALMYLSPHTIGSYIKELYKHFDVSSQPMLMKRFIFGDDHDVISND